jgi:hypothetical protein
MNLEEMTACFPINYLLLSFHVLVVDRFEHRISDLIRLTKDFVSFDQLLDVTLFADQSKMRIEPSTDRIECQADRRSSKFLVFSQQPSRSNDEDERRSIARALTDFVCLLRTDYSLRPLLHRVLEAIVSTRHL